MRGGGLREQEQGGAKRASCAELRGCGCGCFFVFLRRSGALGLIVYYILYIFPGGRLGDFTGGSRRSSRSPARIIACAQRSQLSADERREIWRHGKKEKKRKRKRRRETIRAGGQEGRTARPSACLSICLRGWSHSFTARRRWW